MASVEKITVSLPKDLAVRLRSMSETGLIDSVSGYVSQAVQDRMERQQRASQFLHRAAEQVGQADPEGWEQARAWANTVFNGLEAQGGSQQGAA
ncbi:hypothetical protein ACFXJ8_39290 [Nonomuraea sp. NPDC059194]|uniref:hypothetical protein n=1 Tax=Nonomuraea sp. NPDC059194 TaxID=3346764 RepID=UPI0036BE4F6B